MNRFRILAIFIVAIPLICFSFNIHYFISEFKRIEMEDRFLLLANDFFNFLAFLFGIWIIIKNNPNTSLSKREVWIFMLAVVLCTIFDITVSSRNIQKEKEAYSKAIETEATVYEYKKLKWGKNFRYRIYLKYEAANNNKYEEWLLFLSKKDLNFPKNNIFEVDLLYDPRFPNRNWLKDVPFEDSNGNRIHYMSFIVAFFQGIFFLCLLERLLRHKSLGEKEKYVYLMIPFLVQVFFFTLICFIDVIVILRG